MPTFRPGKPYLTARKDVDQVAPTGPFTPSWEVVESDPDGFWTGSHYTVPYPGFYLLIAGVGRSSPIVSSILVVRIEVDDVIVCQQTIPFSGGSQSANCSNYQFLAEGAVLHVECNLSNTSVVNMTAAESLFSVVRLGPVRWT